MSVPLLRLGDSFDSHISGDVNIHKSAVIAPGVILQAAANSKIIIGPGVCIGMGSILQVNEGILEIEAGANLGAGFLMVGQGKIGANACIGAATTVFNCSVTPQQVVPPGSILGDSSRQIEANIESNPPEVPTSTDTATTNPPEQQPEKKVITSTQFSAAAFINFQQQSTSVSPPSPTPKSQSPPVAQTPLVTDSTPTETTLPGSPETNIQESEPSPANTEPNNTFGTQIYGQGSINRLLITLFPHRQSLSDENSDHSSE
ncbi:transferase [Sphaerospermopsis aphanizomenoides BCCUSP55]|uniref:transferase n=1 Tax=Sphaerospermopsis aphanizomenoides TaxID=459663 RepID=UPI000AB37912|nr:transferase [Sphaerospermopsis aphanizomenoides]MBK1988056.1 transferase [Sphaerospermopsis aphanizomenoides BCCUSP55]